MHPFFHNGILCVIYVSMIYIIANPLHSSRDSLKEIRNRIIAVTVGTLFCLLYTLFFKTTHLYDLGLLTNQFVYSIIYTLILNTCLFWGPIVMEYTQKEEESNLQNIKKLFSSSFYKQLYRYLIHKEWDSIGLDQLFLFRALIVGPITEEIVYRSCMQPQYSGILSNAFLFALSHLHHLIEHVLHGKLSFTNALFQVLFQFSYTFVFSLYTSHVFVKFNSIYSSILLHAMCNALGFPNFQLLFSDTKLTMHLLMGVACFIYVLLHF